MSFDRVTRAEPCRICGRPDWCVRLAKFDLCMRIESAHPSKGGGWMHPKADDSLVKPLPPKRKKLSDRELDAQFAPIVDKAFREGYSRIPSLARELGVDTESLFVLEVGHAEIAGEASWTFPERAANGLVVGIVRRLVAPTDGRGKLCYKGSRRGLTYARDWHTRPGPIWIVEGGSDVAAGLSVGMCVVGRPSNTGGCDMLAGLLRPFPKRRIIVLGENDRKPQLVVAQSSPTHNPECPSCLRCWPGKAGATQVAKLLAKRLQRGVDVLMPPAAFKDLREFVNHGWKYDTQGRAVANSQGCAKVA